MYVNPKYKGPLPASLNWLRAERALSFLCVVDASGNGTHETIQSAVDDGFRYIWVAPGEYVINTDILLAGQSIVGQSPKDVRIVIRDDSKFELWNDKFYNNGDVEIGSGVDEIDGVGTLFESGSGAPGGWVEVWANVNRRIQKIKGVSDETTMKTYSRLYNNYHTGDNYEYYATSADSIGSFISGVGIEWRGTVRRTEPLLNVRGIGCAIENCHITGHHINVPQVIRLGEESGGCKIAGNMVNSGRVGIQVRWSSNNRIYQNFMFDQNGAAISIYDDPAMTGYAASKDTVIAENKIVGTDNRSIEFASNVQDVSIVDNFVSGQPVNNIYSRNNITRAWIEGNKLCDEWEYGFGWGVNCIDLQPTSKITHLHLLNNTCGNDIRMANVEKSVISGNNVTAVMRIDDLATGVYGDIEVTENVLVGDRASLRINDYGEKVSVCRNIIYDNAGSSATSAACLKVECTSWMTVCGNIMFSDYQDGIDANCTQDPGRGVITGNNILWTWRGIRASGTNMVESGNNIRGCRSHSIVTQWGKHVISNNIIKVEYDAGFCIRVAGEHGNVVSNNFIDGENGSKSGIEFRNYSAYTIVQGNNMKAVGGWGITNQGLPGGRVIIEGNNIELEGAGADGGINIGGEPDFAGENPQNRVLIRNNRIDSAGANYGIHVESGARWSIISSNEIISAAITGIHFDPDTGEAGAHSVIRNNLVRACGIGIHSNESSDRDASKLVVSRNNVIECTSTGIQVNSREANVSENKVQNNNAGIDLHEDNCIVRGGLVATNTGNGIEVRSDVDGGIIESNVSALNGGTNIVDNGVNTRESNNIT